MELLLEVMQQVGADEFHSQPGLLTICKKWYDAALPTFREKVTVHFRSPRPFPPSCSEACKLEATHVKHIVLELPELERPQVSDISAYTDEPASYSRTNASWRDGINHLDGRIISLAEFLPSCKKLESVRLHISIGYFVNIAENRFQSHLHVRAIVSLLCSIRELPRLKELFINVTHNRGTHFASVQARAAWSMAFDLYKWCMKLAFHEATIRAGKREDSRRSPASFIWRIKNPPNIIFWGRDTYLET